jgi:hypothetical protein
MHLRLATWICACCIRRQHFSIASRSRQAGISPKKKFENYLKKLLTSAAGLRKDARFTSRNTPNFAAWEPRVVGTPATHELCERGSEHRLKRRHSVGKKREGKLRQYPVGLLAKQLCIRHIRSIASRQTGGIRENQGPGIAFVKSNYQRKRKIQKNEKNHP